MKGIYAFLLSILSAKYDIGNIRYFGNFQEGMLNEVYFLQAERGKYVLKRHVFHNKQEKLKQIYNLLCHLESKAFPCDYFVMSNNGTYWFEYKSGVFSLHRYIEGINHPKTANLNRKQGINSILFLARFHKAVWDYKPREECLNITGLPLIYTENLNLMIDYIEDYRKSFLCERYYYITLKLIFDVQQLFATDAFKNLPRIVIHGDYRVGNMIFDGDDVAGVFDWDLIQYAPRLIDVCGKFAENSFRKRKEKYSINGFKDFISIYRNAADDFGIGLTENEIKLIPDIFRLYLLQSGIILSLYIQENPLVRRKRNESTKNIGMKRQQEVIHMLEFLDKVSWDFI